MIVSERAPETFARPPMAPLTPTLVSEPMTRMFCALGSAGGRFVLRSPCTSMRLMPSQTERYFAYAASEPPARTSATRTARLPRTQVDGLRLRLAGSPDSSWRRRIVPLGSTTTIEPGPGPPGSRPLYVVLV